MLQFDSLLHSITEYSDTKLDPLSNLIRSGSGDLFGFKDICQEIELVTDAGIVKKVSQRVAHLTIDSIQRELEQPKERLAPRE